MSIAIPPRASWRATDVTRFPSNNPPEALVLFRPGRYSDEELTYFLAHLGESPLVAMHGRDLPAGVNPVEVERVLGRIYQLEELRKHRGVAWAGLTAIQDSIARYFNWMATAKSIDATTRRSKTAIGPVRHASMHEWDSRKQPHKGGIGADGNEVITEILSDGTRRTFDVDLLEESNLPRHLDLPDTFLAGVEAPAPTLDTIEHDAEHGTMSCSICKFTQNYPIGSRPLEKAARGRLSRHLKTAKTEIDRHRALWAREFR